MLSYLLLQGFTGPGHPTPWDQGARVCQRCNLLLMMSNTLSSKALPCSLCGMITAALLSPAESTMQHYMRRHGIVRVTHYICFDVHGALSDAPDDASTSLHQPWRLEGRCSCTDAVCIASFGYTAFHHVSTYTHALRVVNKLCTLKYMPIASSAACKLLAW